MALSLAAEALTVKVVLLGESSVGKTSLVNVVQDDAFSSDYTPTVGSSFIVRTVVVDDIEVKLNIWDTAGQERYRALTPMYYRDAHFVVLVYAVDNTHSFDRLESWRRDIENECNPVPHLVILGNKLDLADMRTVSAEAAEAAARAMDARFYEISAKDQPGDVIAIFDDMARQAREASQHREVQQAEDVCLAPPPPKAACRC
jgi:small GTP-binding protein